MSKYISRYPAFKQFNDFQKGSWSGCDTCEFSNRLFLLTSTQLTRHRNGNRKLLIFCIRHVSMVFREAEFSDGSRISHTGELYPKGGANLLFGQNDPENCMKMKKNWAERGGGETRLWCLPLWIRHWNWTIPMLCEASNKKSEQTLASQLFFSLGRWRPLSVFKPFALTAETININVHTTFRIKIRIQGRIQEFLKGGANPVYFLISKNPMKLKKIWSRTCTGRDPRPLDEFRSYKELKYLQHELINTPWH